MNIQYRGSERYVCQTDETYNFLYSTYQNAQCQSCRHQSHPNGPTRHVAIRQSIHPGDDILVFRRSIYQQGIPRNTCRNERRLDGCQELNRCVELYKPEYFHPIERNFRESVSPIFHENVIFESQDNERISILDLDGHSQQAMNVSYFPRRNDDCEVRNHVYSCQPLGCVKKEEPSPQKSQHSRGTLFDVDSPDHLNDVLLKKIKQEDDLCPEDHNGLSDDMKKNTDEIIASSLTSSDIIIAAKSLHTKRTLTLMRWFNPKATTASLKQRLKNTWDQLPEWQKKIYISQVVGICSSSVMPIINPELEAIHSDSNLDKKVPFELKAVKRTPIQSNKPHLSSVNINKTCLKKRKSGLTIMNNTEAKKKLTVTKIKPEENKEVVSFSEARQTVGYWSSQSSEDYSNDFETIFNLKNLHNPCDG